MTQATLINCFEVPADREAEFLELWGRADELLRTQGGYASTRLHRAILPGTKYQFVNVAELASVETWRSILSSPEFGAIVGQMTEFRPTPGLFQVEIAHEAAPAADVPAAREPVSDQDALGTPRA
jgi:hypothetical protein